MANLTGKGVYQKATAIDKKRDREFLAWVRTNPCANCGSAGEYVEKYGRSFCEAAHITVGGDAVKGSKPLFSALPLCRSCHFIQHQRGHAALRPVEWWLDQKQWWLRRWLQLVR